MEQISLYHTLFMGSLTAAVLFLSLTIVLYIRLEIKTVLEFLRRNKNITSQKTSDFRIEREIIMIHSDEIIE